MSDFDLGYRDPLWNKMDQAVQEIKQLKDQCFYLTAQNVNLKRLCARAAEAISISEYDDLVRELREAAK